MPKIIVFTNLTLDGVMQGPARPEEDTRDGFQFGGWGASYAAMTYAHSTSMANVGPMLFGRRTYMDFYGVWANRTDNPYSEQLTNAQKYVASRTLKEPLPWANSILIKGELTKAVADLKARLGKDFLIFGSGVLVQSLLQSNLVDFFVLLIHPLILGSGHKLFPEGSPHIALDLVEVTPTPNGVVIATYKPKTIS